MNKVEPTGLRKVPQATDLYLQQLRQAVGPRVPLAFVNGCFDIFHAGHERCLRQAGVFGMPVVVAINSDEYLRRTKRRPFAQSVEERAARIMALPFVRDVVVFDDDTPERLIDRLRPSLVVKGPDYAGVTLPEGRTIGRVGATLLICDDKKLVSSTELAMRRENAQEMQHAATAGLAPGKQARLGQ